MKGIHLKNLNKMKSLNLKTIIVNTLLVLLIFLIDRFSKLYVLNIVEMNQEIDIYLNSFLNLYLVWNKGIAFGLFSFDLEIIYNTITALIIAINIVIVFMIIFSLSFKRYSLILVLGGSLGNLFDRMYYSAVPDFIDFHIKDFHWFIFNVADIFISVGIILLIFYEVISNKKKIDETN